MNRRSASFLLLTVSLMGATLAGAQPSPYPPTNMPASPLFPADNWWNADVSSVAADATQTANFTTFLAAWAAAHPGASVNPQVHPDWGGINTDDPPYGTYGMIYITVPGNQPRVPVTFTYSDESDTGWPGVPAGYPIPAAAITQPHWIEGGHPGNDDQGEDQHMLIVDTDNRLLYELSQTHYSGGAWFGDAGAIFPLDSNYRRPEGWTSSDAAGLAILPGLVRYDEVRPDLVSAPEIKHAFRVTIDNATASHVFPASHTACNAPCPAVGLPMGARLRLKTTSNPTIPPGATAGEIAGIGRIVAAMKKYGLIIADNGTSMLVQGAFDTRWNNDVLNPAFHSLHASDFEVLPLGWKPTVPPLGAASSFYTLTPCRMLDTRQAAGPTGGPALTANVARSVQLINNCAVPPTAKSLSINVTVVNTPGTGFLRVYPGHMETPPNVSMVSFRAGTTRADNVVVALSTTGSGTLELLSTLTGVHVLIDVNGYFQ